MPDLPATLWIVYAGVLGLLVGSFLNVVILRLPERLAWSWRRDAHEMLEDGFAGEEARPAGLVREPSHCPHCQHKLAPWDNIPLLSWLLLRGRCRYCKAPISFQYPLVELVTALASAAIVWRFGATWTGASGLLLTWFLVALSGIDFRTQLLPDQLTYPLLWLGLLGSVLPLRVDPVHAIVGAAIGYLALWSIYWLFKLTTGKEGMGYGDFKLLAALGAWMGPLALLPIALISSLVGAILGGLLIALNRHKREVPIPFGPFLAVAGWIWFVCGDTLWNAYAHFVGLH
ncbi:MAG TPA: A24 family peptidase [Rhodanobacteraceae bacterium]